MTQDNKITFVWCLLILATLLSFYLGPSHGATLDSNRTIASIIIIAVACIKVRLIGLWFMDLREAIVPLRLIFEAYVIGIFGLMIYFYL